MTEPNQLDLFDALNMDSDSWTVYGIIINRLGREQAVSVDAISEQTGIAGREVRDIVKRLIEQHHVRIGSALAKPSGYYMIQSDEEAEANERTLRRLGLSILVRASVLKRLTVAEYMKRLQTELEMTCLSK